MINSRKFDQSLHRSWQAELVSENNRYWQFTGVFEQQIVHSELGTIRRGTISHEFYWKRKYFSVFRFHEPDGELRFFYCNINEPPRLNGNILDFVDLDIDILVGKDLGVRILDLDEYQANSRRFKYPQSLKQKVDMSIDELLGMIETRSFPFDFPI